MKYILFSLVLFSTLKVVGQTKEYEVFADSTGKLRARPQKVDSDWNSSDSKLIPKIMFKPGGKQFNADREFIIPKLLKPNERPPKEEI